jgi:hypothetical protein
MLLRKEVLAMTENLKIFIALVILQEDTTVPANWDDDEDGMWPWRHINIVPIFATQTDNQYNFIEGVSINDFDPAKFYKDIAEIHHSDISVEVEKIRKEIENLYSGEIQILYR